VAREFFLLKQVLYAQLLVINHSSRPPLYRSPRMKTQPHQSLSASRSLPKEKQNCGEQIAAIGNASQLVTLRLLQSSPGRVRALTRTPPIAATHDYTAKEP
jgi:hypothetical protein